MKSASVQAAGLMTFSEHRDRVSDLVIELDVALPREKRDRVEQLARAIDELVVAAYAHGARAVQRAR